LRAYLWPVAGSLVIESMPGTLFINMQLELGHVE